MTNARIIDDEPTPILTEYNRPTFISLRLINFLSYKDATVNFGDIIALVGPNASGKSNFVSAIKLLRDVATHGLPVAVARRGGFDQLRHRSNGRPNNPAMRLTFKLPDSKDDSYYEIAFSSVAGGTYKIRREVAHVYTRGGGHYAFTSNGSTVITNEKARASGDPSKYSVAPGHSAVTGSASLAAYLVYATLTNMQTVEISPQVLRDFQEPTSLGQFDPDGSNVASVYDSYSTRQRIDIIERLNAIVPGITKVEVSSLAGQQTLTFGQQTPRGTREFSARQMSDGTLRAFGILVAVFQPARPALIVIEEPEVAIHLGALRAMIDILQSKVPDSQIVLTTHSADIVDQLDVESLRIVWTDGDHSRIARVSDETANVVREQLLTAGELMRSHALDPEGA